MSPQTIDFSKYESAAPAQIDFSKYETKDADPAKSSAVPSFWDTLSREGKALTGLIAGIPAGIYHAVTDPPTMEEAATGLDPLKLAVHRLTTAPAIYAAQWYKDAAQGKHGDASAVESALLNEAPEAIGQGAGTVIAGKLAADAPGAAKAIAERAPEIVTAAADAGASAVRGTAKGVNTVLAKAPGSIGAAAGAAVGQMTGIPGAATAGGIVGGVAGHELLPRIQIPGEHFGFPERVTGGPTAAPPYVPPPPFVDPGAPLPEHPGTFPGAPLPANPLPEQINPSLVSPARTLPGMHSAEVIRPPAQPIPARPGLQLTGDVAQPEPPPEPTTPQPMSKTADGSTIPRTLSGESALRDVLSRQDNDNLLKIAKSRGINVTQESQLKPGIGDKRLINKIVDDFSDNELDEMRSTYAEQTRMGRHDFGDIGAEANKTLAMQTYFPDVKVSAAVLKRTQAAIEAARAQRAGPPAAPAEDLTPQLQQMLQEALARKQAQVQ